MLFVGEVDLPVYIVTFREVFPEMSAAALLATEGSTGDQCCDGDQIALPRSIHVGTDRHSGGGFEARRGVLQSRSLSKQPDGAPHQCLDASHRRGNRSAEAFALHA